MFFMEILTLVSQSSLSNVHMRVGTAVRTHEFSKRFISIVIGWAERGGAGKLRQWGGGVRGHLLLRPSGGAVSQTRLKVIRKANLTKMADNVSGRAVFTALPLKERSIG